MWMLKVFCSRPVSHVKQSLVGGAGSHLDSLQDPVFGHVVIACIHDTLGFGPSLLRSSDRSP